MDLKPHQLKPFECIYDDTECSRDTDIMNAYVQCNAMFGWPESFSKCDRSLKRTQNENIANNNCTSK